VTLAAVRDELVRRTNELEELATAAAGAVDVGTPARLGQHRHGEACGYVAALELLEHDPDFTLRDRIKKLVEEFTPPGPHGGFDQRPDYVARRLLDALEGR